jgi:glycosyltransferase involved in cell wall biosynthesis
MIVKNERQVIRRCLSSLKQMVDYWVIVDTGSTDGTQEEIKDSLAGIPGELHESPWVNFAHNRNIALSLAKDKADYILIIDADEQLQIEENFNMPLLNHDFYYITSRFLGTEYCRTQLIKNSLSWKWTGVVHEFLSTPEVKSYTTLKGIKNLIRTDGSRSTDPQKYQKDVELLKKHFIKNPSDSRTVFYLAQSYRDCGEHSLALLYYEKRASMDGWDQEIFWSLYQIAILQESLGMPHEVITASYLKAFHYRPIRAEPLCRLACYYRRRGDYDFGYHFSSFGLQIPVSEDILFIEQQVFEYEMLLECSICAYWMKRYEEAKLLSDTILKRPGLSQEVIDCVNRNLSFISSKLPFTLAKE